MYNTDESLPPLLNNVKCNIDITKMSQVLRNLLSNALKFTPSGGAVTVSAEYLCGPTYSATGILKIQVKDTGCGISEVNILIFSFYIFRLNFSFAY